MYQKAKLATLLASMLIAALALTGCTVSRVSGEGGAAVPTEKAADGDSEGLVIPMSELDGDAHFYTADLDGAKIGVIAVKLADGSVRTAFNACQVCFDSGKGYFEQEGDELVCQNCGTRFGMDQVGLSAGGCNPVPIRETDRQESASALTVPLSTLHRAASLFPN